MEPARQKWFARIVLIVLSVAGLAWLAHLDFGAKISTNVVDLIPRNEQSPELTALHTIVNERQARTQLFALRQGESGGSPEATAAFADSLRQSGKFSEVSVLSDPRARDALGRFIYDRRFQLLLPSWLVEQRKRFETKGSSPKVDFSSWLAEQSAARLDQFLNRPESVAFRDLVPTDPLLLVPGLAERAQALGVNPGDHQPGLIWALLRPSPFVDAGQKAVFDVIDRAFAQARTLQPGLTLEWTGVNHFAAESKDRIRGELSWLNTLSLLAVFGVAAAFVRRLWKAVHLVPVVLFSLLGAWVATTAIFPRTHILVFVLGSLLSGVAIDYGFYLYVQPALRAGESYREKLSRLLKPLLASCLTTVIGFSFLLFSELPLIRELGVFVSGGLIAALLGAILYFAQLDHPYLETRTIPPWFKNVSPRARTIAVLLVLGLATVGWFRLQWRDDVRELEVPTPELRANDLRVRGYFGDHPGQAVYLTRGNNLADARDRLSNFLAWHDAQHPDAPGSSLARVLPSRTDFAEASQEKLELFLENFRIALAQHGYDPESFDAFFLAARDHAIRPLDDHAYETLAEEVVHHLAGPIGLLVSDGKPFDGTDAESAQEARPAWFITLANHPAEASLPPELSTIPLSQLESLNELFARYRTSALRLSGAGLALVGLSVFVLYGIRRGARIFSIPAGSCFIAFGLLGVIGHPLNLFYLLGAFLGVCLSHNYAIFSAENASRHEAPPPSIRLSALCTAASFGVLAFSHIPVVAALGTIVTIIVLTALLIVETTQLYRAR